MSKPNDGGPAFPQNDAHVNRINNLDGMTLRDWFAGQALAGMYANPQASGKHEQFVDAAFKAAGEMIERRKL